MREGAAGQTGDNALSEVVGFVLIIAIIIAAFSLYLTYGVPAQGRENEIILMDTVKDQFVDYKIGLDSLSTNNKVGTTVSNSFTLGTEGGYTQGMMSVIPIMSPVKSSGILSVDLRTTYPETLGNHITITHHESPESFSTYFGRSSDDCQLHAGPCVYQYLNPLVIQSCQYKQFRLNREYHPVGCHRQSHAANDVLSGLQNDKSRRLHGNIMFVLYRMQTRTELQFL